METVILDKSNYDCCAICTEAHLENSLGYPLNLPPSLREKLDSSWAIESEEDLLVLFALMKGSPYKGACRDNSYNHESDLDTFFIYTVYAPDGASDWMWTRDCFVVVEIGGGGDPRYSSYGGARVYDLGDTCLGDSGFFEWKLGWFAQYLDGETEYQSDETLETVNEKLSSGYSNCPTHELSEMCYSDPIWVEKRNGFVARVKEASRPLVFNPTEPYYG